MKPDEAFKLIIGIGLLLFFMRPISGLFLDAFKVTLRLSLTGVVLDVLPFHFLNEWSKNATGWAHVAPIYVPAIALMALVALSTANLIILSGTRLEQYVRLALYVVGGVFSIGSVEWIAYDRALGSIVTGVFGIVIGLIKIFSVPLGLKF